MVKKWGLVTIASFLGLDAIAFQEEGVRKLDGMLYAMQLNPEPFADRSGLVEQVLARVKAQWKSGWKGALCIEAAQPAFHDSYTSQGQCRFHFLAVRNLHDRKAAQDCQVFPVSLHRVGSDKDLLQAATELKWTGYINAAARIRPGTARSFDAIVVPYDWKSCGFINGFTDATDYRTGIVGAGEYDIEFEVTSSNFPTAKCRARITLGATVEESEVKLHNVGEVGCR